MRSRAIAGFLLALAGCNGHRIVDRSLDPIPEPFAPLAPIATRVICIADTGPAGARNAEDLDRVAILDLVAAEEVAARLRLAGVFRSAEARGPGEALRHGELEIVFTERILEAAGRGEGRARETATGLLWFTPAFPFLLVLDFVYLEHGAVRAVYTLECRAPDGELIVHHETTSVLGVEEQASGCPGMDQDRPWLGHGPVLVQARDRAQRVLVGAFARDQTAHTRIRNALREAQ